VRRICKASETSGRKWGSGSQQRCINPHKCSVNVGCVGRGGRLLCIMANVAIADVVLLNGIAPVNTCGYKKSGKPKLYTLCITHDVPRS